MKFNTYLNLNKSIIFVLLYPLFYAISLIFDELNYAFANYYFAFVFIIFISALLNISKFTLSKYDITNISILLLLLCIISINTTDIRYTKPAFFISYVIVLYLVSLNFKTLPNLKHIHIVALSYLVVSCLFFFLSNSYEDGRFLGFALSPTVYSVYLEIVLIIVLTNANFTLTRKIFIYLAFAFFVYLTHTRTNLAFLIIIPALIWIYEKFNYKKVLFIGLIVSLNFVYVIYKVLLETGLGKSFLLSRYDGGKDPSFSLRYYLFDLIVSDYLYYSSFIEQLFGKGAEYSRLIVVENISFDILPHNDFIRLTSDFGVICLLLYLVLLYRLSTNNLTSYILVLLYLFTFYHNLLYSYELVSLIILFNVHSRLSKSAILNNYELNSEENIRR
jgi:hypothetical protein